MNQFIIKICAFTSLVMCLACGSLYAQSDHMNLEDNIGATVEDAYPTAFRNRELQGTVRYDRTKEGENKFLLNPALELGLFRNTQFKIAVPVYAGNAMDKEGSGNIEISALYNFNQEGLFLPAFAIVGQAGFPSGKDNKGVDYTTRFILTKSISKNLDRIHFNFDYTQYKCRQRRQRHGGKQGTKQQAGGCFRV